MNCKLGGLLSCDKTISEKKVCNNVEIEPLIQSLTNEHLKRGSINADLARVGVRARVFRRRGQNAFFDIRVINPGAATQAQTSIEKILENHERKKRGLTTKES